MDAHNSAILVPYHAWRISHRTHHANHGHVENDESWHPTTESLYEKMDPTERMGRLSLPFAMMAYPFYLVRPSPPLASSCPSPGALARTAPDEPRTTAWRAVPHLSLQGLRPPPMGCSGDSRSLCPSIRLALTTLS